MISVLIVDDEPVVCEGMRQLIDWNSYGFQVCATAGNGQEALELQLKEHYDLIITDLKMPAMGGIELIRKLWELNERCKVVIISAYGEFSFAQAAMQYGVRYYLLKPVDENVLCGYLSRIAEELSAGEQEEKPDQKMMEHQYNMCTNGVITEIRRYINDHYSEPLTLNSISKVYNFSPVYIGRLFKKEMGCSFNEYLNHCRINVAKKYICEGKLMIYEIGEKVGYKDSNYFYKCFKNNTGLTPKEYKSKMQKKDR